MNLEADSVISITQEITALMKEASTEKIHHGHLSLDSIWINSEGEVKVTDFVLRQRTRDNAPEEVKEKIVDPRYFKDVSKSGIDESTDLYSLGVCIYKALTGVFPGAASHNLTDLELDTPDSFNGAIQNLLDGKVSSFEELHKLLVPEETKEQVKVVKTEKKAEPKKITTQSKDSESPKVNNESRRLNQQKLRFLSSQLLIMRLLLILSIACLAIFAGARYMPNTGFGKASERVLNNTLDKAFAGDKGQLDVNEILNEGD